MLKKVLFFLLILPLSLISQNLEKINLYLDCYYLCDKDFLKREMPFVNFMRDPSDSHVQVIVKSENSASGGKRLSFRFIGLNEFQGKEDYYFTSIAPDISKEEKRVEILDLLKKGLFTYILKSEEASNFVLSYELKNDISTRDTIDDFDIWRNWVFRLNFSGWANIEKGYTNQNYNSRITINKITENSKFHSSFRLNNSKIIQIINLKQRQKVHLQILLTLRVLALNFLQVLLQIFLEILIQTTTLNYALHLVWNIIFIHILNLQNTD